MLGVYLMKNNDNNSVICIGEILIDFICTDIDVDLASGTRFIKSAGGAPGNVAATIAKLGGNSSFIGKVGNDSFGDFLKNTLEDVNVDTSMIIRDVAANTTLAFVSLKADGERDFVFNRGSDGRLHFNELDLERIVKAKIVHFGSATALLDDPFRKTYLETMKFSKENNIFIAFDPNYRDNLWQGREQEFIQLTKECITYADFVKVSEEELELITGYTDKKIGINYLHQLGVKIVAVTLGEKGTLLSNGDLLEIVSSINVKSIDSTGAGDAFVGAMLFQLAKLNSLSELESFEELKEITAFSNRVAAIVCTKIGAIASLPEYNEVIDFK